MRKTVLILIGIIFLSVITFGINEGDIIPRAQFNQLDFSNADLKCHYIGSFNLFFFRPHIVFVNLSCLFGEEQDNRDVKVIRTELSCCKYLRFGENDLNANRPPTVEQCRNQGYTFRQCWLGVFKPWTRNVFVKEMNNLRLKLNDMRDPSDDFNPSDWSFDDNELRG